MQQSASDQRALDAAGLDGRITFIRRPPNYLGIHPATFMLGVLYEKTIERMIPALRTRILVEAVRPSLAHYTPEHNRTKPSAVISPG